MSTAVVSVERLKKSFGDVKALNGISFEVKEGEVFGLVGPDGAGKTTIIRILVSLLSADSGLVRFRGKDVAADPAVVRSNIGYMPQRFSLYPDLTVDENLRFYADIYGVKRKTLKSSMEKLLEWSSLAQFRKRSAGKLSGGMKQKLGLACALIHTPKLLLLDEPTNGVDPVSRKEFWNLLYKLVEEGLTIVMTTAYLDESERCHRLAFMEGGKITAMGTPIEITDLVPEGVFKFYSDDPFGESYALSSTTNAVSTVFGSQVHVMGNITVEEIERALNRPLRLSRTRGSVEDAFVYLSGKSHE